MKDIDFGKFNSLFDIYTAFPDEKTCIAFLESRRWPNGVVSPFDPTSKVYRRSDGQYRCSKTEKNFNVRIGTIFENTKLPLRIWFIALFLHHNHKKGISAVQLSRDLGVSEKTAWFMLHKMRRTSHIVHNVTLEGEVEIDETFVGGKNKNRHWNKKVKPNEDGTYPDKTPVMGMLQRGGQVICKVIKDVSAASLTPNILKCVKRTATLFTDGWKGYIPVCKIYKSESVNHRKKIYVIGNAHTNSIEGFWGTFCKRVIHCIYNAISRKYMQRYFDEFSFRYNTRKASNQERFEMAIAKSNIRVTYNQILENRD